MLSIPSYLQQLMRSVGAAVSLVRNAGIFGTMYSKCTRSATKSKASRKEKASKNPRGLWLRKLVKGRDGEGRMRAFVWEEGLLTVPWCRGILGCRLWSGESRGWRGSQQEPKWSCRQGKSCLIGEGKNGSGY